MRIAGRGRPLRFLIVICIGWITARVAMVYPHAAIEKPPLIVSTAHAASRPAPRRIPPARAGSPVAQFARIARRSIPPYGARATARPRKGFDPAAPGSSAQDQPPEPPAAPLLPGLPRPADTAPPPRPRSAPADIRPRSRWSGSAWSVVRGGAGLAPGALGGQLGGSQAGVRLVYALDVRRRIAIVGRVTTPIGDGLREASLGVEWQPTRLPIRLVAEQRIAVTGGQGGPGVGVIGGIGPIGITRDVRLEAYAQAGVIRRIETEPYVDGAVRITHPVASLGRVRFDLGAGVWGGAQRGAARLDIGPSLGIALPLGKQPVRFALDWRARIAGQAHPGSGPALTLGTDF